MPADQPVFVEYITIHYAESVPEMEGSCAWAPQGHRQGCDRLHRQSLCHDLTRGPRSVGAAMISSRKIKNGTDKASGSIYAEKKTFFGATEEGGVKALVYELGTGKAQGERIEETSPWMSAPTYKEAMARQRQFMRAHEYLHPPIRKRVNAASSSIAKVLPTNLPRNRGRNVRLRPPVSLMGSPLRL